MKKQKNEPCCPPPDKKGTSCCSVAAVVTVDERGQMVLPKEVRDWANIKAGDKLALVSMGEQKDACCLMLIKTKELNDVVRIRIDSLLGKKDKKGE